MAKQHGLKQQTHIACILALCVCVCVCHTSAPVSGLVGSIRMSRGASCLKEKPRSAVSTCMYNDQTAVCVCVCVSVHGSARSGARILPQSCLCGSVCTYALTQCAT